MAANVGSADRIIRFVLGFILIIIGIIPAVQGILMWVLIAFGAILLLTSFTGMCAIYSMLGMNTRKTKPAQQ